MDRSRKPVDRDPTRRVYPVVVPERRGGYWQERSISPVTGIAVGLGVVVLAAAAGTAMARRSSEAPRPLDDAERRFREGGHWNDRYAVAGRTVLINRPRAEVYAFWRDFSNQSKFMKEVEDVRVFGKRLVWTFANVLGGNVDVEAQLTEERENERLAWSSLPGSAIAMHGSVEFRDAPAGRGTYVELELEYVPPAGAAGRAFVKLTRRSPQQRIRHGLKRLKMLLEAGEVATSAQRKEDV